MRLDQMRYHPLLWLEVAEETLAVPQAHRVAHVTAGIAIAIVEIATAEVETVVVETACNIYCK